MQPQALRQIVAADNAKERTIMWQLKTEKDCTLEYRMKESDRISSEKATSKSYKGNNGVSDSYLYTARLTNLTRGTDYEYRTRTGDTVSAVSYTHLYLGPLGRAECVPGREGRIHRGDISGHAERPRLQLCHLRSFGTP